MSRPTILKEFTVCEIISLVFESMSIKSVEIGIFVYLKYIILLVDYFFHYRYNIYYSVSLLLYFMM